jgi:hypothetical protein
MQFAELPHESEVTQLVFTPDSKYIATVSSGAAIGGNAAQGKKKRAFAHPGIHQVAFSELIEPPPNKKSTTMETLSY